MDNFLKYIKLLQDVFSSPLFNAIFAYAVQVNKFFNKLTVKISLPSGCEKLHRENSDTRKFTQSIF